MKHYDLFVIGSGAGNIVLDAALQAGKSCALAECGKYGGTCLNRGCIPTKILATVADKLEETKLWDKIGITAAKAEVNWETLGRRMWAKLEENRAVRSYYEAAGVSLYDGVASFIRPGVIQVKDHLGHTSEEITAEKIVVAAGARSAIPEIEGLSECGYVSSESFFAESFPKKPYGSLLIVGGGAIACEFAHIFAAFGTKVIIVQHNRRLLPKADAEISAKLLHSFRARGISVILNQDVIDARRDGGLKFLHIKDRANGEEETYAAKEIMIAAGIRPNSDRLQAEKAALSLDEKGYILVNEALESSSANVYALGDIIGHGAFRHKANYEAELLSYNLYKKKTNEPLLRGHYAFLPQAIFSSPQVAQVGWTEEEARRSGRAVQVAIKRYSSTAKGYALGYDKGDVGDGFVKMLVDKHSSRIIGLHIIGHEAAMLLAGFVYLLEASDHEIAVLHPEIKASAALEQARAGQKAFLSPDSVHLLNRAMTAHPSLSEVVAWAIGNLHDLE